MHQRYSFEEVLSASERFSWRVEDLIGGERRLDFSKPLLPESLVPLHRGFDELIMAGAQPRQRFGID